jgi:hypothetical protein
MPRPLHSYNKHQSSQFDASRFEVRDTATGALPCHDSDRLSTQSTIMEIINDGTRPGAPSRFVSHSDSDGSGSSIKNLGFGNVQNHQPQLSNLYRIGFDMAARAHAPPVLFTV